MANPNNCATCDHKRIPDGGYCYMFRDAPTEVCAQHTGHSFKVFQRDMLRKIAEAFSPTPPLTCISCGAEGHKDQPLVCGH